MLRLMMPIDRVGQHGNLGLNNPANSTTIHAHDGNRGYNTNWSGELRFRSNFEGPFNFVVGLYHLDVVNAANYLVVANTLDYMGIDLGPFTGGDGTVFGTTL